MFNIRNGMFEVNPLSIHVIIVNRFSESKHSGISRELNNKCGWRIRLRTPTL